MQTRNTITVLVPIRVMRELNCAKAAINKRVRKGTLSSSLPRLYTTQEVCAIFGVDRHTVLTWNKLGALQGHSFPGNSKLFFFEEDIQSRIMERQQ